jgi:hypothetical protein
MTDHASGPYDEYLRDLAEATRLSRAGAWDAAVTHWHRVTTANPDNGNHWESLARACYEAGRYERALNAYRKVDDLGVTAARHDIAAPGAVSYRIACCHACLGDPTAALSALADAVHRGYRDLGAAWDDEHLASLRPLPRLADLLGRPHPGLTREERWRFDAGFLVREIERRAPRRTPAQREVLDESRARLAESLAGLTDAQVVVEFMRWVAALDDGHGSVDVVDEMSALAASLPVQFQPFDEGVCVTAAHPGHAALLGARVVAFEDCPVGRVLDRIDPLVSRDNVYGALERAMQVMRRTAVLHALGIVHAPDGVELELEYPDGTRRRLAVPAVPQAWRRRNEVPAPDGWIAYHTTLPGVPPLYLRDCARPHWFEYLAHDALVYFQFNSVSDGPRESLAEFSDRLFTFVDTHAVRRLVIDVRWNGGGDLTLVRPLVHGLIRRPAVNRPGGLFVITGRRTFSAAQHTCSVIEANTHAVFVGEPTGSRPNFVGETTPFRLPCSGLQVNVSDVYWQNGWPQDRRTSIAPELRVTPTIAACRANRDLALEAVLACGGGAFVDYGHLGRELQSGF